MASITGFSAYVERERSVTEQGALCCQGLHAIGHHGVCNRKIVKPYMARYQCVWPGAEPGSVYGFEVCAEAWRTRDEIARWLVEGRRYHRKASKCADPSQG